MTDLGIPGVEVLSVREYMPDLNNTAALFGCVLAIVTAVFGLAALADMRRYWKRFLFFGVMCLCSIAVTCGMFETRRTEYKVLINDMTAFGELMSRYRLDSVDGVIFTFSRPGRSSDDDHD